MVNKLAYSVRLALDSLIFANNLGEKEKPKKQKENS